MALYYCPSAYVRYYVNLQYVHVPSKEKLFIKLNVNEKNVDVASQQILLQDHVMRIIVRAQSQMITLDYQETYMKRNHHCAVVF